MGNWDACFLEGMPEVHDEIGRGSSRRPSGGRASSATATRTSSAASPKTLEVPLDDGASMFCFHGSPISYDDWIFAATPEEDLARMFDGIEAPVLVGGHTHLQMIRRYEDAVIVNPGSVGLSFKGVVAAPDPDRRLGGVRDPDPRPGTAQHRPAPNDVRRRRVSRAQPGEWDAPRRLVDRLLGARVTALYREGVPPPGCPEC